MLVTRLSARACNRRHKVLWSAHRNPLEANLPLSESLMPQHALLNAGPPTQIIWAGWISSTGKPDGSIFWSAARPGTSSARQR